MPHASASVPLRGNQETESYRVYLDCLVVEDITVCSYVTHDDRCPFDDIALYSGWLACGSSLTYPRLSERVMQQFG